MKYMLIFEFNLKSTFLMDSTTLKNEMNKIGFQCLNNVGNVFYTDDLVNIITLKDKFNSSDFISVCLGSEINSYNVLAFDSLSHIEN